MAISPGPAESGRDGGRRDHGYHPLRVRAVEPETDEAVTVVLDVTEDLREAYRYDAGQFVTFRVWIDGRPHLRSYSMSSAPVADPDLRVTVKRVPGGLVSNWLNDALAPGAVLEATPPAGVFCLGPCDGDVVAFSAGSGITPVISIIKEALATTSRRVHLLYANREPDAVIFRTELARLEERWPGRLRVVHHFDVDRGFVDAEEVRVFSAPASGAEYYVCGPGPFMDVVEQALHEAGVGDGHIHIERFTPSEAPAPPVEPEEAAAARVTIELGGRAGTVEHRPGTTILQTARQMGMAPPFSCESGSCATCMAKLVQGSVVMHVNNALTHAEVEDGWVLTCQAVPTTPSVRIIYDPEEP